MCKRLGWWQAHKPAFNTLCHASSLTIEGRQRWEGSYAVCGRGLRCATAALRPQHNSTPGSQLLAMGHKGPHSMLAGATSHCSRRAALFQSHFWGVMEGSLLRGWLITEIELLGLCQIAGAIGMDVNNTIGWR